MVSISYLGWHEALTGSYTNTACLWDLENLENIKSYPLSGHADIITSDSLTPDSKWALTGSRDGTAWLWDVRNPDDIRSHLLLGHTKQIYSVALTPDGRWALTGSHDKTARLWELIPRMSLVEVQKIIGAHEERTRGVMISHECKACAD